MSIGTFIITKNERPWIGAHVLRLLPHVDEMVFFDGNSNDGTLDLLEAIRETHHDGAKIRLFKDRDPADLNGAYVALFDSCLREVRSDWAWFLHPDMHVVNPEAIRAAAAREGVAQFVRMDSYAGDPGHELLRIAEGRGDIWKTIFRLRRPDLGAHYFGHYGAQNEDVYFREITGDTHDHHGGAIERYPYQVPDSGIEVMHFSDVRPYRRRLERMERALLAQGWAPAAAQDYAPHHPRVHLTDGQGFRFLPAEYPPEFLALRAEAETFLEVPA